MRRAYAIEVPSFFGQEVNQDEVSREVSLAFLDDLSLSQLRSDVDLRKPPLPPAAAEVKWGGIWEAVGEEDVQNRIANLQLGLRNAREIAIEGRRKARELSGIHRDREEGRIVDEHRARSSALIQEHIEFLNSGQSGIRFTQRNGKLMVVAHAPQKPYTGFAAEKNFSRGISLGLGIAIDLTLQAKGAVMIGLICAMEIATSEGLSKGVSTLVEYVRRPSEQSRKVAGDFYSAERDRVNYWFSAL